MLPSGEVTFHMAGVIPFVFVSSVTADELSETLLSGAEVTEAVLLSSPVVVVSAVVSAVVVVVAFELLSVVNCQTPLRMSREVRYTLRRL